MSDHVTVHGLVATEPRHLVIKDGLEITSFRLAAMQRRFDRQLGKWRDDGTNWYSVASFRILAKNAAASLEKGHRVIVSGRLKVREWDSGERSGVSVDIEADSIGHDLVWGSSTFERNTMPIDDVEADSGDDPDEPEDSNDTF